MLPENLALLAALTMSIVFGVSDALWKIPLRIFSPEICIFIRNIGTTLFLGITAFLAKKAVIFDFNDVFYGIFISCISFFGLYFFGKSQKYSNISLIAPLLILLDFIIFLMGVFYWKESANITKWLCFGLFLVGSFLISFQSNNYGNNYQKDNKNNKIGIKYGLLAAVFWGVSYSFFKDTTQRLGVATFGFILEATIFVMSILVMIFMKIFFKKSQQKQQTNQLKNTSENQINQPKISQHKALFFLLIISSLGAVGIYCSNLVYATLPVSSIVIVGIFGKIIPVLIGKFFYKEHISRQQYVGIVLQIIALAVFKFV